MFAGNVIASTGDSPTLLFPNKIIDTEFFESVRVVVKGLDALSQAYPFIGGAHDC